METNQRLAEIFSEIGQYLAMDNLPFKPAAYENTSLVLMSLNEDIAKIYKKGGQKALMEIPTVGTAFAKKIEEFLKSGKISTYEKLKKKIPVELKNLGRVEGLGPRKIKILYQKLGIKNLDDLKGAVDKHKIAPLFGFGKKTEENLNESLAFVRREKDRFPLEKISPIVEKLVQRLKKLKEIEKISAAGSVRRKKKTIGDIDILAQSKRPDKVMDYFCRQPEVVKIWGKGKTKSSVRLKYGFDVDLRIVPKQSYGAALIYFTGSKEHNILLRKRAIDLGYKLNEYGIFNGKKMILALEEKDVYRILGLKWISPEKRLGKDEIDKNLL